jgi:hypothetical protein
LLASAESKATLALSALLPLQLSIRHRSIRRGKRITVSRVSATAIDVEVGITPVATQVEKDSTPVDNFAES